MTTEDRKFKFLDDEKDLGAVISGMNGVSPYSPRSILEHVFKKGSQHDWERLGEKVYERGDAKLILCYKTYTENRKWGRRHDYLDGFTVWETL